MSFGKSASLAAYALDALQEVVGLPERFGLYTLVGSPSKDVVELAFEAEGASTAWYLRWLRVVSDYSDPSVDRYFSRVRVALLENDLATTLVAVVTKAIAYWRRRADASRITEQRFDSFAISRLRFFIEILSRLTARQNEADARRSFVLAMELAADPNLRHPWLREQVGQLAQYAVKAIPPDKRSEVVLDLLGFPLPRQWAPHFPNYASPIYDLLMVPPQRAQVDNRWTSKIAELVSETTVKANRAEAALRLIYLSEHGVLNDIERQSASQALWSQTDGVEPPLPGDTRLYPHVFADLPAPTGIDAKQVVRERLFGLSPGATREGAEFFGAIIAAATATRPLLPSREHALALFEKIIAWRPMPVSDAITAAFEQSERAQLLRSLGPALAKAIVPALDPSDQTVERGRLLLKLIDEASAMSALWALPFFVWSFDDDDSRAFIDRIRRGLLSGHFDEMACAAAAVSTWADLAQQNRKPSPPLVLIEQICTSLDSFPGFGFDSVLQAARHLVEKRFMPEVHFDRVTSALERLVDRLSYERASNNDQASVTVSLARAECVRLAVALETSGVSAPGIAAWLEIAASDALPEVRFAILSE